MQKPIVTEFFDRPGIQGSGSIRYHRRILQYPVISRTVRSSSKLNWSSCTYEDELVNAFSLGNCSTKRLATAATLCVLASELRDVLVYLAKEFVKVLVC